MAARLTRWQAAAKTGKIPATNKQDGNARLRGAGRSDLLLGSTTALAQPKSAGAPDPRLVEDLVAANRVLVDLGVLDGFGHVSVRHDKDASRYLMSRSMAPALVEGRRHPGVRPRQHVPSTPRARPSFLERFIHDEIYKAWRNLGIGFGRIRVVGDSTFIQHHILRV